jgi:hypothetical protein
VSNGRIALIAILTLASLAALLATPVGSGWALRAFSCDLGGSPDWVATIVNIRHLVSFGGLAALAFLVFREFRAWVPILLLVVITASVELEEAIFASGHCRLRDMLPDLIAIGLGWLVARLLLRISQRRDSRS